MTNLNKKVATVVATGALLLQFATPVLGATYTVSGNARGSNNYIDIQNTSDTTVTQNNNADIQNDVNVATDTGSNRVSDTTGASQVEVTTGASDVTVGITNDANHNAADVNTCGDCGLDGEFKVTNNARDTQNTLKYRQDSDVSVDQDNYADVDNEVNVNANSGRNRVTDSGAGDVLVNTGAVKSTTGIVNTLNSNVAMVGSAGDGGMLSLRIAGNGRESANLIDLLDDSDVVVDQYNDADVANDVNVAATSGENRVMDSLSDMVEVYTGDVTVGAYVDNMANFNAADVADCCLLDLTASIDGNARETENTLKLRMTGDLEVDQDNEYECGGSDFPWPFPHTMSKMFGDWGWDSGNCADVDVTGATGGNVVTDSVGGYEGDPLVDTGASKVTVGVTNAANTNVYGMSDYDFSDDSSDSTNGGVYVNINMAEVMDLLHQILAQL